MLKIYAFLLAVIIQCGIVALIYFGGILDPLLGLAVAGIYFFVIGLYLMYRFLSQYLFKAQ